MSKRSKEKAREEERGKLKRIPWIQKSGNFTKESEK